MRNCLRPALPPFRERRGGDSQPGSARLQVSRHFCTLTHPSRPSPAGPGPLARKLRAGQTPDLRALLPPFTGGLHCGSPGATPGQRCTRCSRPSPAGSIAACRPPSCPLAGPRVLPPFTGGLHCGTFALTADLILRGMVLPPFTGGLHCGTRLSEDCPAGFRCSRRLPAGSIAATPGRFSCRPIRAPAPAVHRRATCPIQQSGCSLARELPGLIGQIDLIRLLGRKR